MILSKKKVAEDWITYFNQLSKYSQNQLFRIVGACIIGIEIMKSPFADSYSPYFVIYPLWRRDVKVCLIYPILLKGFYNRRAVQWDIPYEKHSVLFNEVAESVINQMPILAKEYISLNEIISVLDKYSKERPLSAAPSSYLQAELHEAKFKIALTVNIDYANDVLEQILIKEWDSNHFKACGVNLKEWLEALKEILNNHQAFFQQIESNKADKKISLLNKREIVSK